MLFPSKKDHVRPVFFVWVLCAFLLAVVAAFRIHGFFSEPDVPHYIALANGRPAMLPFASRQLGPLLVRGLAGLGHMTTTAGFFVEGTLALLVVLCLVASHLIGSNAPRWIVPAVLGSFFWVGQYTGLMLPDLFYSALLCVLIFLLQREYFVPAMLMFFPLALARESTMLTVLCFIVAGWGIIGRRYLVLAVVSTVAGLLAVKNLATNALPNSEHISPVLYLFAKMPWNILRNVFGVVPWANVYRSCATPEWLLPLHLGPLSALGICSFEWRGPEQVLFEAIAAFGLLPVLVWKVRRVTLQRTDPRRFVVRFCWFYGLVSYVIAAALGASVGRLFWYAWPLYFVALPHLLARSRAHFTTPAAGYVFVGLQLAITWLQLDYSSVFLLVPELILFGAGLVLIKSSWADGAVDPLPVTN